VAVHAIISSLKVLGHGQGSMVGAIYSSVAIEIYPIAYLFHIHCKRNPDE